MDDQVEDRGGLAEGGETWSVESGGEFTEDAELYAKDDGCGFAGGGEALYGGGEAR